MKYLKYICLLLLAISTYAQSPNAVISQLGAKGVTETGGTTNFAHYIPRLGPDGKISGSMISASGLSVLPTSAYIIDASFGSDTTNATGSISAPYKTIAYAITKGATNNPVFLLLGVNHASFVVDTSVYPTLSNITVSSYFPYPQQVITSITYEASSGVDAVNSALLLNNVRVLTSVSQVNNRTLDIHIKGGSRIALLSNSSSTNNVYLDPACTVDTYAGIYNTFYTFDATAISYAPSDTNNWTGTVGTVSAALDRLAETVNQVGISTSYWRDFYYPIGTNPLTFYLNGTAVLTPTWDGTQYYASNSPHAVIITPPDIHSALWRLQYHRYSLWPAPAWKPYYYTSSTLLGNYYSSFAPYGDVEVAPTGIVARTQTGIASQLDFLMAAIPLRVLPSPVYATSFFSNNALYMSSFGWLAPADFLPTSNAVYAGSNITLRVSNGSNFFDGQLAGSITYGTGTIAYTFSNTNLDAGAVTIVNNTNLYIGTNLSTYVSTGDLRVVNSTTNVTGGILSWTDGVIGLTAVSISNAIAGLYALVDHVHGWTSITNVPAITTNNPTDFAAAVHEQDWSTVTNKPDVTTTAAVWTATNYFKAAGNDGHAGYLTGSNLQFNSSSLFVLDKDGVRTLDGDSPWDILWTNLITKQTIQASETDPGYNSDKNSGVLVTNGQPLAWGLLTNPPAITTNRPEDFATAAQGSKADTALQSEEDTLNSVATRSNNVTHVRDYFDFGDEESGVRPISLWLTPTNAYGDENHATVPVIAALTSSIEGYAATNRVGLSMAANYFERLRPNGTRAMIYDQGTLTNLTQISADGSGLTGITAAQVAGVLTNAVNTTNPAGVVTFPATGVVGVGTGSVSVAGMVTNTQPGVLLPNLMVGGLLDVTGRVSVVGTADVVQLSVKANATQNSNVLEVADSSGTVKMGLSKLGHLLLVPDNAYSLVIYGRSHPAASGLGQENTLIGCDITPSMQSSAAQNSIYGHQAGYALTSGDGNTLLGYIAGNKVTSGEYNTMVGHGAGNRSVSTYDTFIGYSAGGSSAYDALSSTENLMVGQSAGLSAFNSTRAKNTIIGANSFGYMDKSLYNITLGYQSGPNNTTATNSIFIGYKAGYNQKNIENLFMVHSFATFTNALAEQTNALFYGVMSSNRASQSLQINANVTSMTHTVENGLSVVGSTDKIQLTVKASSVQNSNVVVVLDNSGATKAGISSSGNMLLSSAMSAQTARVTLDLSVGGNATVASNLTATTVINRGVTNLDSFYWPVYTITNSGTNTLTFTNGISVNLVCTGATPCYITAAAMSGNSYGQMNLYVDNWGTNVVTWDTNVFNAAYWPELTGTNGTDLVLVKTVGSTMLTVNGPVSAAQQIPALVAAGIPTNVSINGSTGSVSGGVVSVTVPANQTATTLPIADGTATVSAAACWLSPGNGTNVVLLPGTWAAGDQVLFGVAVSNFGYGTGYTNSLTLPTNLWSAVTATNIVCTNPATVYWLIGGRGAQQTTFEVRQ